MQWHLYNLKVFSVLHSINSLQNFFNIDYFLTTDNCTYNWEYDFKYNAAFELEFLDEVEVLYLKSLKSNIFLIFCCSHQAITCKLSWCDVRGYFLFQVKIRFFFSRITIIWSLHAHSIFFQSLCIMGFAACRSRSRSGFGWQCLRLLCGKFTDFRCCCIGDKADAERVIAEVLVLRLNHEPIWGPPLALECSGLSVPVHFGFIKHFVRT